MSGFINTVRTQTHLVTHCYMSFETAISLLGILNSRRGDTQPATCYSQYLLIDRSLISSRLPVTYHSRTQIVIPVEGRSTIPMAAYQYSTEASSLTQTSASLSSAPKAGFILRCTSISSNA